MKKINLDNKSLRKFGITMGIAFTIIAVLLTIRHKQSPLFITSISAGFFICAFIGPLLLKPVYFLWMKFAFILSWINTRIILFIIFYLVFMPVGTVMRILGKDLLKRKIDKSKNSYWDQAEKQDLGLLNYERQY